MLLPKNNTIAGENSLNSGNARSYVSATPVTVTVYESKYWEEAA